MVLLGDEAQLEARFGPFGDSPNLDARYVHGWVEHTIGWKSFWMHPMELLGDVGHVEPCFDPFEDGVSVSAS